jgi:hypothetical protein
MRENAFFPNRKKIFRIFDFFRIFFFDFEYSIFELFDFEYSIFELFDCIEYSIFFPEIGIARKVILILCREKLNRGF